MRARFCVRVLDNLSTGDKANLAAFKQSEVGGKVFNVCTGEASSVNNIFETLQKVTGKSSIKPNFETDRIGDIKHSFGNNSKARELLGFEAKVALQKGLTDLLD
ncbi:MAG: hypothetical protein P8Y18_10195 [Candidatus Bathyarchaeota archaeon]